MEVSHAVAVIQRSGRYLERCYLSLVALVVLPFLLVVALVVVTVVQFRRRVHVAELPYARLRILVDSFRTRAVVKLVGMSPWSLFGSY